MPIQE
jgi:hypothetical protein